MSPVVRQFRDFFVSLKLTVVLLALSIVLIFWATLAQVQLGIWGVQEKFFHAFFVLEKIPGTGIPVPVFPGGYFLGGLLLINLVAAHIYRFRLEWKKAGIQLTHLGLILLLLGELFTSLLQVESNMRLDEGETRHYSESYRTNELAILDTTSPDYNEVVAIPEAVLSDGGAIQHPKLPFQVRIRDYYPNAALQMRDQVPNAAPALATAGIGPRIAVIPLPLTYKQDERNAPAANIEFVGPEGTLGTWLVSPLLGMPQKFDYAGRTWEFSLRFKRYYHPFAVTLLKFTHEVYAGTEIPKNFSSRIRLQTDDARQDREVLIYMNNPLRHAGLTFYQAGFDNDDKTTILQVVRNPSWVLPYVSCIMMGLGLLIQFGFHLTGFMRKRSQS
ncbi:cytochrome c biogenesis protein ResB [Opitutus sp. GAS368]|uniref:cytochrome c biogenesis protein ResB n=1 Tax=Opitutus sp. GAS368 TaxID=1882749 RepID=UPI00087CD697|nr:cytochrome c biogenesis protein ResB [Opitutus sp. GAS368]SDR65667.1 ResB-like family protein [Opitutus sp. GAS368]